MSEWWLCCLAVAAWCGLSYGGGVFVVRAMRRSQEAPFRFSKTDWALLWVVAPFWMPFWAIGWALFFDQS